jgi:phospholipase/carboxylesterase
MSERDARVPRRVQRPAALAVLLALLAPAGPAAGRTPDVRSHFFEIRHVMSCRVLLPPGYDPDATYPLLVALHGAGGGAGNFDALWQGQPKARCLLAAPEAPYPMPTDARGGAAGRSWYLLVKDRRIWELADPLAAQGVIATVEEMRKHYRIGSVYVLGFSQGASLAYQAAVSRPDIFAGVLAVAGQFPEESLRAGDLQRARGTLRVFIAHGDRDRRITPRASERARERLQSAGFQVTYQAFRGGHEVPAALFLRALLWMGAADAD